MKTFDIVNFEKKKSVNNKYSYKEGDTIIIQSKEDYFREYKFSIQKKNFKKLYTYNNNGNLIGEATYFLGLLTGKVISYNEEGKIIRERDFTRLEFPFTVEQVAEKMKKDYGLDLYNIDGWEIHPQLWDNKSNSHCEWWVIGYLMDEGVNTRKTFRIDGKTGKLLGIENGSYGILPN